MKKITISNNENIKPKFIYLEEISEEKDIFIGRNRRLLTFPIIITNFLRDTKLNNVTIKDVKLGYYPEMSQIDKTVLSGEAIPAWRIVLETGEEYIYNAYLGERMSIIADDDM
jgi:tetrahydromethanopterin S-methyltransferase subunit F